jgi:hypothetical protein
MGILNEDFVVFFSVTSREDRLDYFTAVSFRTLSIIHICNAAGRCVVRAADSAVKMAAAVNKMAVFPAQ